MNAHTKVRILQVSRPWLVAFVSAAFAAPLSLFVLGAVVVGATLGLREWAAVVFYISLVVSFVLLLILRNRFISLPKFAQWLLAIAAVMLLILGYAMVIPSVQHTG